MPERSESGDPTTRELLRRMLSDRRAFEHSLDALVAENRFTIAVVFP
ncbi:MAG: hypothetical protein ACI8TL_001115, partial [Natronomonas sp.]